MQMKFATLMAFVAAAFAAADGSEPGTFDVISIPSSVNAGESVTVTWYIGDSKYENQDVTIQLIGGPTQTSQVLISTLASGYDNSLDSFTWTVDSSLGTDAFYGIEIILESDKSTIQWSNPFSIVPISKASTTAAAVATTAATTAAGEAIEEVSSTATATNYGVKTVSLSQAAQITTAAAAATEVVPVYQTVTVPCNTTTQAAYYPPAPQATVATAKNYFSNGTWTTAVAPTQAGSSSGSATAAVTPIPVAGAGSRFAAPLALVGGIVAIALAL